MGKPHIVGEMCRGWDGVFFVGDLLLIYNFTIDLPLHPPPSLVILTLSPFRSSALTPPLSPCLYLFSICSAHTPGTFGWEPASGGGDVRKKTLKSLLYTTGFRTPSLVTVVTITFTFPTPFPSASSASTFLCSRQEHPQLPRPKPQLEQLPPGMRAGALGEDARAQRSSSASRSRIDKRGTVNTILRCSRAPLPHASRAQPCLARVVQHTCSV